MKFSCSVLSTLLIFAPFSTVLAKAPETAKIVFRSGRDGNFEIYIMNLDGSDQKNLTQHRAQDVAPVWSPTGKQILFQTEITCETLEFSNTIVNKANSPISNKGESNR